MNKVYNASFQQNVFLADSLGAPIYWAQSVVYIHHVAAGWAMNFTAWVSYPFWGIYPTLTVSEWWFPVVTHVETLPLELNLTTQLVPGSGTTAPRVDYSFGVKGSIALSLPVPGALYIVGTNRYSYSWQGVNYTDGPKGNASPAGFLSPQFGLLGGPGDGIGNFLSTTNGTIGAYVEPFGATSFELADTAALSAANHQSGETDSNLTYTPVSHGNWTFGYAPGSTEQGILEVQPSRYTVLWNATGTLPSGTLWFVNLSSGLHVSAPAGDQQIVAQLQNGSYGWTIGVSARGWAAAQPTGTVVVDGTTVEINVTLALMYGDVTFNATGPSFPFQWYVNVTGGPSLESTSASIPATLTFGTYSYRGLYRELVLGSHRAQGDVRDRGRDRPRTGHDRARHLRVQGHRVVPGKRLRPLDDHGGDTPEIRLHHGNVHVPAPKRYVPVPRERTPERLHYLDHLGHRRDPRRARPGRDRGHPAASERVGALGLRDRGGRRGGWGSLLPGPRPPAPAPREEDGAASP